MTGIVKHLLQVMVVGHAHLDGVRVGLTEIGLSVVSQIVAMLIPVEWVSGRRIFHTVDVALGVRLLLKELPSTTRYLVGTRSDMRLTNTDERTWQYHLWSLDILYGRNTALELHMDVHYVTLADRSDVCTRSIALLIVILVDDGDNLLLREVEDVREAADVQCTGLRRSNTVDAEVRLVVGQTVEVALCDDESHRNGLSGTIGSRYATRDLDTCDLDTIGILANGILLTAVVVGLVLLCLGKGQCGDVCLIRLSQAAIRVRRDDGAHSVWGVAYLEWGFDNIYVTCILHVDSRVVALLVRQFLVLLTAVLVTVSQRYTVVSRSSTSVIGCGVVDRSLQ